MPRLIRKRPSFIEDREVLALRVRELEKLLGEVRETKENGFKMLREEVEVLKYSIDREKAANASLRRQLYEKDVEIERLHIQIELLKAGELGCKKES